MFSQIDQIKPALQKLIAALREEYANVRFVSVLAVA